MEFFTHFLRRGLTVLDHFQFANFVANVVVKQCPQLIQINLHDCFQNKSQATQHCPVKKCERKQRHAPTSLPSISIHATQKVSCNIMVGVISNMSNQSLMQHIMTVTVLLQFQQFKVFYVHNLYTFCVHLQLLMCVCSFRPVQPLVIEQVTNMATEKKKPA